MMELSKRALTGSVGSIFMLAFFTIVWAFFIPWGLGWNPITISIIMVFILFAGWLYIGAIKAIRIVGKMTDAPVTEMDKRIGKRFGLMFGIEFALMMVSGMLLGSSALGNPNYITPVFAFIVGAHCIPLGVLFHTRIHIILGIIIMAVAIITIIFLMYGQEMNNAIGVCAVVTTLCVAIMGEYLLLFVNASLKRI